MSMKNKSKKVGHSFSELKELLKRPMQLQQSVESSIKKSERHHALRTAKPFVKRSEPKRAIVGVDFGTSFTKAFCKVAGWGDLLIKFDVDDIESYFLPTVLFYDKKKNLLKFKKDSSLEKIEYFKYGILDDSFGSAASIKENNKMIENANIICAIFFLACTIDLIKSSVQKECGTSEISFAFNMGCPIANFNKEAEAKGKYDQVLHLAYKLYEKPNFQMLTIDELNRFMKENDAYRNPSLQTVPELFAEALCFIESTSVGEGVFSILDVGGGTVDCATISIKFVEGEKKTRIYSQGVAPYGVEVLLQKLFGKKSKENRNDCIDHLREADVEIPSFGKGNPLQEREHILGQKFREVFFRGVTAVKEKDPNLMQSIWDKDCKELPYYSYGGGADFNWYHSIISHNNPSMSGMHIPSLAKKTANVGNLPSHRLVIAQQLARPYFPEIDGFPWNFKEQKSQSFKDDWGAMPDYLIIDT